MADTALLPTDSYFPAMIRYTDTGEEVIVDTPEAIQSGRAFTVIKTRVVRVGSPSW